MTFTTVTISSQVLSSGFPKIHAGKNECWKTQHEQTLRSGGVGLPGSRWDCPADDTRCVLRLSPPHIYLSHVLCKNHSALYVSWHKNSWETRKVNLVTYLSIQSFLWYHIRAKETVIIHNHILTKSRLESLSRSDTSHCRKIYLHLILLPVVPFNLNYISMWIFFQNMNSWYIQFPLSVIKNS